MAGMERVCAVSGLRNKATLIRTRKKNVVVCGRKRERERGGRAAERLAGVVSFNNQWQGRQDVRMDAGSAWATSTDI